MVGLGGSVARLGELGGLVGLVGTGSGTGERDAVRDATRDAVRAEPSCVPVAERSAPLRTGVRVTRARAREGTDTPRVVCKISNGFELVFE